MKKGEPERKRNILVIHGNSPDAIDNLLNKGPVTARVALCRLGTGSNSRRNVWRLPLAPWNAVQSPRADFTKYSLLTAYCFYIGIAFSSPCVTSIAMAKIRIGTSGWHYKHWVGNFYPAKLPSSKMLAYYYDRFDTVEINNSFYMLPRVDALNAWREATPENFEFAVKASRFLTHNKKLKEPENALRNFLPRAEALGKKLGPILFQLPPKWRINLERLAEFLDALPKHHRYTFEFREPSWLAPETYDLLRKHNAAFCIYELAGFHSPIEITADWTYIRLHGPRGKYQGSYTDEALCAWAERIAGWNQQLKSISIYFDNDQAGYAASNAFTLKEMVDEKCGSRSAA